MSRNSQIVVMFGKLSAWYCYSEWKLLLLGSLCVCTVYIYILNNMCVYIKFHFSVVPGGWETQYSCCSSGVGSPGCQVAKVRVL